MLANFGGLGDALDLGWLTGPSIRILGATVKSAEITDYHAKYFAHELTRRFPPGSSEKLAGVVASAQVDLNPHQVDAALFAFNSPLSKGALLADEVADTARASDAARRLSG